MAAKKKKAVDDEEAAKAKGKKGKKEEPEDNANQQYARGDPRRVFESTLLKGLRKSYGKHVGKTGRQPEIPRLSSGIAQLDKHLGGGWAKGYWHVMFGDPSSSKTTTLLRTIGIAQKTCRNCNVFPLEPKECGCGNFEPHVCAYIRLEEYDPKWAGRFINLDELLLFEPLSGEEALDTLDACVRTGEVDVIGLDSVAFMTPKKEIESSMQDEHVGLQPRMIGKGIRKANAGLAATALTTKHRPTVFLTNQIRFKVGVMFGSPITQPGGQAPLFAAGTEVKFNAGQYKSNKEDEEKNPLFVEFDYRINKNKTGIAKCEGTYRMALVNGDFKKLGDVIDEPWMVDQAVEAGVVSKPSDATYVLFGQSYRGIGTLIEALYRDKKATRDLRDTLMAYFAERVAGENRMLSTQSNDDEALSAGVDDE